MEAKNPKLAHYPSWGFETCPPRTRLPSAWLTHYPSWGFETFWASGVKLEALDSLPLMGI